VVSALIFVLHNAILLYQYLTYRMAFFSNSLGTETPIVKEMYSSILHKSHPCVVSKTQWLEMENVELMETPRYSMQVSRITVVSFVGGLKRRSL
jgi:hypothetical protein